MRIPIVPYENIPRAALTRGTEESLAAGAAKVNRSFKVHNDGGYFMKNYYDIPMSTVRGRKALWIVIVLIIVGLGAGLYAWMTYTYTPAVAAIIVVSPKGGEAWDAGSTHTISWTTSGIPSSDKISVTIRRIPPPPLQIEGQEFDPIVFTDLPNTGNAAWTISDMYPSGTYVLGLNAYESVPITNEISAESAEFTLSRQTLSQVLYPLYSDANWEVPKAETVTIGTSTYSGASVSSVPVTGTMDPGSIFTPFLNYYDSKLKALGWKVDNYLAAGGHVGGQTGYRKADGLILVRFSFLYHTVAEAAPSECPCDVTFSLFSEN